MASVKDLMKRRVSTPRRVQVVDTTGAISESAPKSRVAGRIPGQTKAKYTNAARNDSDNAPAPVLPTATVHVAAHRKSPPITLSAKDALAVSSDQQLLETAHVDVNDTRNTLEEMDSAISGLADWRKEQAENLAKLRRQLRREVSESCQR